MSQSSRAARGSSALRTHVISGDSPRGRGVARGAALAAQIARTCADYASLFAAHGISADDAREAGLESHDAATRFDGDIAAEIEGIAEGARIDLWHLCLVVARTEILSLAPEDVPGRRQECSTVIYAGKGGGVGAQTWDWHADFHAHWHRQLVEPLPGAYGHAGLTEYGMLAKVGLNSAGVGTFLNILRHADDAPGAVPIHVVIPAILSRAATRAEAIDIIAEARLTSSSAISLVDGEGATIVEVSPRGHSAREVTGFAAHTNDFLDDLHAEGARRADPSDDSGERLALLESRLGAGAGAPERATDLLGLLKSGPGEAELCCRPDSALPFGMRFATLATAVVDAGRGVVGIGVGSPLDFDARAMELVAPPA